MSKLKTIDKMKLEQLFNMGGGYVLGFSDRTFADFFLNDFGIEIDQEKYRMKGTSKANRLRSFWAIEDDEIVAKVLTELLRVAERSKEDSLYVECQSILNRLIDDVKNIQSNSFLSTTDVNGGHDNLSFSSFSTQRKSIQDSLQVMREIVIEKVFEKRLYLISNMAADNKPSCFISHAWGRNADEKKDDEFVRKLEKHLDLAGVITYYDGRSDERGAKGGVSLPQFMSNIDKTDYIVVVYTPAFKEKYDKKTGITTEVDYILNTRNNPFVSDKLIPILFDGDSSTSIPSLLISRRYYEFTYSESMLPVTFLKDEISSHIQPFFQDNDGPLN